MVGDVISVSQTILRKPRQIDANIRKKVYRARLFGLMRVHEMANDESHFDRADPQGR